MAKKWNYKTGNVSLIYLLRKANKTKSDIGKVLNVSNPTIHTLINNPYLMTLAQFYTIAGYINIDVHKLIYLCTLDTPKTNDSTKWFTELKNDAKNDIIAIQLSTE